MPRAAVLTEFGKPLEITDLDVAGPGPDEVLVRYGASGVCHTDRTIQIGALGFAPPIVLGHEGAGVVEAVGEGVTGLAEGDHVVLSWVPQCGACYTCSRGQPELCEVGSSRMADGTLLDGTTRFRRGEDDVRQAGYIGTFSEAAVVPASAAVRIPADVPLDVAALIGCGVLTGFGAAVNTGGVRPGDRVVVVGCGGVGLNAVQGARVAGAERIVALDVVPEKLELARRFGATDTVDPARDDAVAAVASLTDGRGADVSIEASGSPKALELVPQLTRRGGAVVLVGQQPPDAAYPVPPAMWTFMGQRLLPSVYGGADVRRDVAKLLDLYARGEILLDELVSRRVRLDDVNDALDRLDGEGPDARTVIVYR